MVILLVGWAVLGITRLAFGRPHLLASATFIALAGWLGQAGLRNTVESVVRVQMLERECFRRQVLEAAAEDVAAVYVIQPGWEHWPTRLHRYDDFGVPSSCAYWCPESMFRLIAAELPPSLSGRLQDLPVTWGLQPPTETRPRPLIVDMRKLRMFETSAGEYGTERTAEPPRQLDSDRGLAGD